MHAYIDLFIQKLKEVGDKEDGIDLQVVSEVYHSLCTQVIIPLLICAVDGQTRHGYVG